MSEPERVEKIMSEFGYKNNDPLKEASRSLVRSSHKQGSTRSQQGSTRSQQGSTKNEQEQQQQPVTLSEQASQAKQDLEVLVATGKTQDFLKKQLTFNDLDNMSERELLKYHGIYQTNLALKVNDTFNKIAVKGYTKLVSYFLPIKDTDKLYSDLRNDYILMNELDRWSGWLSLKMGGLMAVATTGLITFSNIEISDKINGERSKSDLNGEEERRVTGDDINTPQITA